MATEQRCAGRENAGEKALTCVEIDLHRWFDLNREGGYFRITLEDAQGYQAFSRAFTRKEVEAYF